MCIVLGPGAFSLGEMYIISQWRVRGGDETNPKHRDKMEAVLRCLARFFCFFSRVPSGNEKTPRARQIYRLGLLISIKDLEDCLARAPFGPNSGHLGIELHPLGVDWVPQALAVRVFSKPACGTRLSLSSRVTL